MTSSSYQIISARPSSKEDLLAHLKKQITYQTRLHDYRGSEPFDSDAWETLDWHIKEIDHLNNLNLKRTKLIARILRPQGRVNRYMLVACEYTIKCCRFVAQESSSIYSANDLSQMKRAINNATLFMDQAHELNHFPFEGNPTLKRLKREQILFYVRLIQSLDALGVLSDALIQNAPNTLKESAQEHQAHLRWHLNALHEINLNEKKLHLLHRLAIDTHQINRLVTICFKMLSSILHQSVNLLNDQKTSCAS